MLIGLLSDTHIPDRAKVLPQKVIDTFSDVELILHAGDLTSPRVIKELEEIAPVMAVQGNMDRVNGTDLPKAKVIEAEGLKMLREANADEAVLKLKSYEAIAKVADGQSTKLIIPSDLSNVTTIGSVLKETLSDKK